MSIGSLENSEVSFLKAFDDAQATIDVSCGEYSLVLVSAYARIVSESICDARMAVLEVVQASRVALTLVRSCPS